jgi:hypothetical protein
MTPDQALEELVQLGLICLNCSVVEEDFFLVSTRAQAASPRWPSRGLAATGCDALPSASRLSRRSPVTGRPHFRLRRMGRDR